MKTKPYILTVTLNPALDKMMRVELASAGRGRRIREIGVSAGGKGINVSRALKNLGIPTLATGFVGGACGDLIEQKLRVEKIGFDFVRIAGETRVNLAIRNQRTGRITRSLKSGPVISIGDAVKFKKKLISLLPGVSTVVFSGSCPPGLKKSFLPELIRLARRFGKKTVVDTSGKDLRAALAAKPFLIKPNQAEAEFIVGDSLRSRQSLRKAAQYFLEHGAKNVIISLGSQGAFAADKKDFWLVQAPRMKVVNPVGCGDALLAGFLFGQRQKFSFADSLRFGVAAGAANAKSLQPGAIQRQQVLKIFQRVRLIKI